MPGRAASGAALDPELAAHHRGRTRVPMDLSQHLCPLFSNLFEIGRLLYLRSDFNSSQTDFNSMSEFQIGRLLWEDFRSQIRRPISDSTSPGWRDVRFQKRGDNSGGDEPTSDVWRRPISKKREKMTSQIVACNNNILVRFAIGRLRRPISKNNGERRVPRIYHLQGLQSDPCGARRLRESTHPLAARPVAGYFPQKSL